MHSEADGSIPFKAIGRVFLLAGAKAGGGMARLQTG
jgi:hypothetical protein